MVAAICLPLLALGVGHPLTAAVTGPARLGPTLHAAVATGIGLLAIYLMAFAGFTLTSNPARAYLIVLGISTLVSVISAAGAVRSIRRVRRVLVPFLLFFAACVMFELPLRHLAGGSWIIDWHEHYSRSLFFTGKLPPTFLFGSGYALSARPPLQNVLCALVMSQAAEADRFAVFQLASVALAAVVFFPCACLARTWSRGRVSPGLMTGVLLLTPAVVIQAVYPWTKLLASFFVLTALALYLQSYRRPRGRQMALVAALLAGGVLTHYSAAPYALVILAHFTVTTRPVFRVLVPALVSTVLLAPWFVWSIHIFGVHTTFASNSTAIESSKSGPLANLPENTLWTVLPHPLLMSPKTFVTGAGLPPPDNQGFAQRSRLGLVRDYAFLTETGVLPLSMGLAGVVLVLPRLTRLLRRRFWRWFLPASAGLALVVHSTPSIWGIAHVTMVPLTLLGVAWAAVELQRARPLVRRVACVLFVLDAAFLTLPHLIAQSRAFTILPVPGDPLGRVVPEALTLSTRAVGEYQFKVADGLVMLGDRLSAWTPLLLLASGACLAAALVVAARSGRESAHRS